MPIMNDDLVDALHEMADRLAERRDYMLWLHDAMLEVGALIAEKVGADGRPDNRKQTAEEIARRLRMLRRMTP